MGWEPGYAKFGDGWYEFPRDSFDPQEYCKVQADYLLQHTEIRALAALFIARMARKSLKNVNVLKEAGLFFTRPAEDLQREVDLQLKRTDKLGPKPDVMKKNLAMPLRRPKHEEPDPCPCPPICTPSIQSIFSNFVTESTSASTLLSEEAPVPPTPTLEEAMEQLVVRAMNNGLNTMYAARERDVVYDEAYLCIISAVQSAVEAKWTPVIDSIKGFLGKILDDVRKIAVQRHRMKKHATDKVPIKTNRLRNHYKGFASEEYPAPSRKEVIETMERRKGTYNRYPKDAFGVYIGTSNASNEELEESVTRHPSFDYEE